MHHTLIMNLPWPYYLAWVLPFVWFFLPSFLPPLSSLFTDTCLLCLHIWGGHHISPMSTLYVLRNHSMWCWSSQKPQPWAARNPTLLKYNFIWESCWIKLDVSDAGGSSDFFRTSPCLCRALLGEVLQFYPRELKVPVASQDPFYYK